MQKLAKDGELMAFKHKEFWRPMDTLRDKVALEEMWENQKHRGKFGKNHEPKFLENKNVLITGHTGFKGSWLSIWLNKLGANVNGYSLKPSYDYNLFEIAKLSDITNTFLGDIRDLT